VSALNGISVHKDGLRILEVDVKAKIPYHLKMRWIVGDDLARPVDMPTVADNSRVNDFEVCQVVAKNIGARIDMFGVTGVTILQHFKGGWICLGDRKPFQIHA